ncbi:unnamed protein product [Rhodiola kirilowii]
MCLIPFSLILLLSPYLVVSLTIRFGHIRRPLRELCLILMGSSLAALA